MNSKSLLFLVIFAAASVQASEHKTQSLRSKITLGLWNIFRNGTKTASRKTDQFCHNHPIIVGVTAGTMIVGGAVLYSYMKHKSKHTDIQKIEMNDRIELINNAEVALKNKLKYKMATHDSFYSDAEIDKDLSDMDAKIFTHNATTAARIKSKR